MKKNEFKTKIRNEIDSQNDKIMKVRNELSSVTTSISNITQAIADFSDFDNVDKFDELKSEKARLENHAELLSRKLAELKTTDSTKIMNDLQAFKSEKLAIFEKHNAKIMELTKQIEDIDADVTREINELQSILSDWIRAYNIDYSQCTMAQVSIVHDDSGILPIARSYLDMINQLRKIKA